MTSQISVALDPAFDDPPWYQWWLQQQIYSLPAHLLPYLAGGELDSDREGETRLSWLWNKIRELVLLPGPKSVDSIAEVLLALGFATTKHSPKSSTAIRHLVFAIIGWQTLLYKPDFASYSSGGYNILDDMDGHRGDARVCLSQIAFSGQKDLAEFLLGFGIMLPPRNHCSVETDEHSLFDQIKAVSLRDVNAHVLAQVCNVRFRWTDSLSCHLELDRSSGALYIFRYPSFCLENLKHHPREGNTRSILYRCGLERARPIPWATEEDITDLLKEILLSFRLIFGQTKRSRAIFRKLQPFTDVPQQAQDHFLAQICGRKRPPCPISLTERDEYDLARDFPHLRSKLVRLSGYASSKKPRSLRQLWFDKRESTAWLALWSVLIFGSLSILLALIQCVFQILQYVDAIHGHDD